MTRKPVLVQLDDDLVDRLDAYAAAHQTNRSAVLREAASVLLDAEDRRADLAEADRQLVESYTRVPQEPELVEWAQAAQDRALADTPNEWTAFEPPQGSAGGSGGC